MNNGGGFNITGEERTTETNNNHDSDCKERHVIFRDEVNATEVTEINVEETRTGSAVSEISF